MIIKHHKPYGKINEDTLPEDWVYISLTSKQEPEKFRLIHPFKLYASAMVWEHHIPYLQIEYGITQYISLTEGNWLNKYENDKRITIHYFPFYETNEMTYKRIEKIISTIDQNPETFLVFSLRGKSKPAKITTAYTSKHKLKPFLYTLTENLIHGYLDPVTTYNIWKHFKS